MVVLEDGDNVLWYYNDAVIISFENLELGKICKVMLPETWNGKWNYP